MNIENKKLKKNRVYSGFVLMKNIFNKIGARPIHIIRPIILSLAISLLDGISLVLLILLIKGIIINGHSFVTGIPVLGHIIALSKFGFLTNQSIFLSLASIIFAVVVLKNILLYVNSLLSDYWNGKFSQNVSRLLFSRFVSFGKLFFDRTNNGYINLVLGYSGAVRKLFDFFQNSLTTIFTLIVRIIIMLIISWKLTIVALLALPFLHYSLDSVLKRLGMFAIQRKAIQIELSKKIFNIFLCIPLIKAYSKEEEMGKIYDSANEQLRKLNLKSAKISNLILPVQDIITKAFLLLTFLIIVLFLAKDNAAKMSAYAVFFYIVTRTLPMFTNFNIIINNFKQIMPQLVEIFRIFDDKDKFFIVEGNTVFKGLNESIDFNHLSFSYIEGVFVLKDINFSIEKGKTTAIVGATSSGKTTLINLIMRFYDCPPASILLDGIDIRDFTLKSLRSNISLVSQGVGLFNDTLRNNITFGLDKEVTDDQLIDIAKKSRLYDLITLLPNGFYTKIGDQGVKLSGGEKQRIGIARTLLKDSEILILDEASSSLDSKTEGLIQEAINEAIKEKTAIIIAHRLSTIKKADKIVVIENGCLVEEGSLAELIGKKGKFYEYWESQKFY